VGGGPQQHSARVCEWVPRRAQRLSLADVSRERYPRAAPCPHARSDAHVTENRMDIIALSCAEHDDATAKGPPVHHIETREPVTPRQGRTPDSVPPTRIEELATALN
jgi:hypothetical protein